jgi:hypothetical protein
MSKKSLKPKSAATPPYVGFAADWHVAKLPLMRVANHDSVGGDGSGGSSARWGDGKKDSVSFIRLISTRWFRPIIWCGNPKAGQEVSRLQIPPMIQRLRLPDLQ